MMTNQSNGDDKKVTEGSRPAQPRPHYYAQHDLQQMHPAKVIQLLQ